LHLIRAACAKIAIRRCDELKKPREEIEKEVLNKVKLVHFVDADEFEEVVEFIKRMEE